MWDPQQNIWDIRLRDMIWLISVYGMLVELYLLMNDKEIGKKWGNLTNYS